MAKPEEMISLIMRMMNEDQAVVISPHPQAFRELAERDFIDRIRRIRAAISAPAGSNPYTQISRKPGRWFFVWVPEDGK